MKKVVKLTERDLTRIVRRVLREQPEQMNKSTEPTPSPTSQVKYLKVLNQDGSFHTNIDVHKAYVDADRVRFEGNIAGNPTEMVGFYYCINKMVRLIVGKNHGSGETFKLTEKGNTYFDQFCNQYVQNKTSSSSGNYA